MQKNVKSGVNMLSTTSTAFGTAVTNSEVDGFGTTVIDDAIRQRALAEEEAVLNQYKAKVQSPSATSTTSSSNITNNPFLSSPNSEKTSTPQSAGINNTSVDLFAPTTSIATTTTINKASDDLLQLNNPFADAFDLTQQTPIIPAQQNSILLQAQPQSNIWMSNGFTTSPPLIQQPQVTTATNNNNNIPEFVPESAFSSVFGNNTEQSTNFDSLGNNLQSTSTTTTSNTTKTTQSQSGILTGDLESSLASLAENLSINSRPIPPKGVQWNSPKNSGKSPNWTPQPMAATNGTGYKPMGQGMSTTPISTLPPSPYQPQLNLGIRTMPTIGVVQPLGVNVPMNMTVYPQLANVQPANISAASPISPQIQAQQKSLLFH